MIEKKFTDKQLIKLHNQKLNDREISEIFNCKQITVCNRRHKLKLLSNYVKRTTNATFKDMELARKKLCRRNTIHKKNKYKNDIIFKQQELKRLAALPK